jgi:invasion protein IalB
VRGSWVGRRRRAVVLAALALVLPVLAAVPATAVAPKSVKLKVLTPNASVARKSKPATFKPVKSASLVPGDTVKTDKVGFAELHYHDGSLARLSQKTTFTITKLAASDVVKVRLTKGQVWNEVAKASGSRTHYQVVTPNATASVRGTAFAVSCAQAVGCLFAVVEGVVNVSDSAGTVDVHAGEQVTVEPSGAVGAIVPLVVSPWIEQNRSEDDAQGRTPPPLPPGSTALASAPDAPVVTSDALSPGIVPASPLLPPVAPGTPTVPGGPSGPVAASAPGAATSVVGVAGDGLVVVSWAAPASDGGSAITGYVVTASPGGATCTAAAPATSCTVLGLANGTSYTFTVTATNGVGSGSPSAPSTPLTPATVPGAATSVVGVAGDGLVVVSWAAPGSDGGSAITGYTATASPGGATCTAVAPATGCIVNALTNGTPYTFAVTATNGVGTGPPSTASAPVTPVAPGPSATVPGAPTSVVGTSGNGSVAVTWSAPGSDGGTAITGYTVTASPGGATCAAVAPTTGCTVLGLTNGTPYTFTVTATNAVGTGSASASSASVTPATVPGAPTGVSGTSGNGSVAVTWLAPGSNGGSAITGYTATASPGGATCTSVAPTTSCTVLGLTNGTPYTFTVTATNGAGTSLSSLVSGSVTPATVPGAPTGVSGLAGDQSVVVSWSAPGSNGGSAITGYTATASPGGATCTSVAPTTSCTVSGLTNGTPYTFTATATNTAGTGSSSAASAPVTPVVPATVPGAPTGVAGVAGNGLVVVSWTAPGSDGGSAITGYTATASPGGATCSAVAPAATCTVSGLTNGTPYTFTVTATNGIGTGSASSASAPASPLPFSVTISLSGATPNQIAFAPAGPVLLLTSPTLAGSGGYQLSNGPGCTGGLNVSNPSGADLPFDLTGLASPMTYYILVDPLGSPSCVGTLTVIPAP